MACGESLGLDRALQQVQRAESNHNLFKLRRLGEYLEEEQDSVQLAGLRCGVQGRCAAVRGHRRVRACRQQLLHDLPAACAPPRTSFLMSPHGAASSASMLVRYPAPDCFVYHFADHPVNRGQLHDHSVSRACSMQTKALRNMSHACFMQFTTG